MDKADLNLYVVKVRRYYGARQATSVIHGPTTRVEAEAFRALLVQNFQDPDAYYIEKWEKK